MEETEQIEKRITVQAKNIGGIKEATVDIRPGVTILAGRNATNKTSLLQAVMAGLGSDAVSLKSDADSGTVTLQFGDTEYTRKLERLNGDIVFDGTPYLQDTEVADLFAFLLPTNEARRTVELGGNLREVIMDPVDTDAIQAEISKLQREKTELEDEIDRRGELTETLARLEQERATIESDIEEISEELTTKQEELADASTDTEQARSEQSELEAKIEELQDLRSTLEEVKFRLDSEQQSVDSLEEEREELRDAQEELDPDDANDFEEIQSERDRLRTKKQQLESELNELQSVIQFNQEMLETESSEIAPALQERKDRAVTDQLLESKSAVCWTCGTTVAEERIEETVDSLRELRQTKYNEQQEIDAELAELKDEQSRLQTRQDRRETVEQKLSEVEDELEKREAKIAELEDERDQLRDEIDQLEQIVAELEQEDRSEVLDLQTEVNSLEIELERLKDDRSGVTDQIEEVENQLEEVDELREQREALVEQLQKLRTQIDRIEQQAVEEFNTHMATIIDILEYDNLDRIWIDRVGRERQKGGRNSKETEFRLHVVRRDSEGVSYEDEFNHLSESEREVTGLVFALAGYLAHDIYEKVPIILLDSLESLDAQRIDTVLKYLTEYAEYLVVTLLPEDAAEVDSQYQRISDI